MKKSKIKNTLSLFITLELILSLFISFSAPHVTLSAAAPVSYQASPANNTRYTAGSNGVAKVGFAAKTIDPDTWDRLKLQVLYRMVGEASWHGYGTKSGTGPNNKPVVVNGVKNQFMNEYGWNCGMGWGSINPPSSCDVVWSNGAKRGYPAWSGYNVYFPSINLTPGTYEWMVRGYDGTYGGFTGAWRFTVLAPPAPPPAPAPEPEPTPELTPEPVPDTNWNDSTETNDVGVSTTVDKTAPSVPANLSGEFNPEDNSVALTWESSTDENEVSGYEIERTLKDQNAWVKIGDANTEEFVDFEFEPQKSYQYRVRAFDEVKNFSAYSNVVDVNTGEVFPNVTVKDGGKVDDGLVTMEFPAGSTDEDLFVTISKIAKPNIKVESNQKLVGDAYEIKAKNSKGEEVTKFKSQIALKIRYEKNSLSGVSESTIKLANYKDDKLEILPTSLARKNKEAKTLTDHLSTYVLVATRTSPWVTFLKIVLWILVIIGLAAGGWYLWVLYQRRRYQQEHRDDYIYRS